MGWDNASYRCVYQMEDESGHRGVRLGKDLMAVAARALRVHVASYRASTTAVARDRQIRAILRTAPRCTASSQQASHSHCFVR